MAVDCNFEEQHPVRHRFISYRYHLSLNVFLQNQLDSTIAILDKYRQSPFTRTFSDKKIRVSVIGYPILLDFPEATSPEANTCFCRIKFCKLGAGGTADKCLRLRPSGGRYNLRTFSSSSLRFEFIQLQYVRLRKKTFSTGRTVILKPPNVSN